MRTNLLRSVLIGMLFLATTASAADLNELEWLAGSWTLTKGERTIEEQWMKPVGGMMVGMGRTLRAGKTVEFEFLRIEQRGEDLVYIAQPNGAPPTEFKMVKITANEIVFENLQHDYPQQIIYTRNADGSVSARTEGPGKQGTKVIRFDYQRAK